MLRAGAAAAGADAPPAANLIAALVREADGVDYIEALQEHENGEVYQKAAAIVDAFFGGDDEPEDVLVAPAARRRLGLRLRRRGRGRRRRRAVPLHAG